MDTTLGTPARTVRRGTEAIMIRRIRPGDAAELERFYAELSPDSRRLRFLSAASRFGAADARHFCGPDHEHREGFVAEARGLPAADGGRRIVGHLCLEPSAPGEVEIAVAVADAFQARGIGRRLVRAAADWAGQHGIGRFRAWFAPDNSGIRRLLAGLGRPFRYGPNLSSTVEVTIDLGPASATSPRAA